MAKRRKFNVQSAASAASEPAASSSVVQDSNRNTYEAFLVVLEQPSNDSPTEIEPDHQEVQMNKKTRGATVMADVWELEPDKKIIVQLDSYGLPVGPEGCMLTSFLGTVARKPLYAPINYEDWRKMPSKHKEDMWELVQMKFSFEPATTDDTKSWILTDLNDKWRSWKNSLKSKVFDLSLTMEQMLEKLNDPRVNKEQLKSLIKFWLTDEAKRISKINQVNKEKFKEPHAAGTKSFARIIHENTVQNNGIRPSRAAIYIKTRYSTKSGDYVTPEAAEIADAMKADLEEVESTKGTEDKNAWVDDVYFRHKGPEKRGRAVRCVGKKITISSGVSTSQQRNDGADEKIAQLEHKMACLLEAFKKISPNFSMDTLEAMTANGQLCMLRSPG